MGELGASPHAVFAQFSSEPVAAASIAQVHRATLQDGESVAVKVQRPGIRPLIEGDLDIIISLARTLERRLRWARHAQVVALAEGFREAVLEELDFRIEARNIASVMAGMAAVSMDGSVRVPRVYAQLSTERVLVLEWLDGQNARAAGADLEAMGAKRIELARQLLRCVLGQILGAGTFHADPHPGNVLVLRAGGLALIDFGSVGRLDPIEQEALRRVLVAIERRNPGQLCDAVVAISVAGARPDEDRLERALAQFMARRLGPGMKANTAMLRELINMLLDFGLAFPPQVGAVFRALLTLEGTLAVLAPDLNMIDEARAQASDWMHDILTSGALAQGMVDELLELLPIVRRLPRRIDHIASAFERGTFSTNVRVFLDAQDRRRLTQLVHRSLLTVLAGALGLSSVLLVGTQGGPALVPGLPVYTVVGNAGLFAAAALALRALIAIIRDPSD